MKKIVFKGAATALITPMNADGSINYAALENLVEDQITNGIDALVICGTTGEGSTLDHEEHVSVIAASAKKAAGRVPIIAGSGSNDTAYAVTLSKEALDAGADALLMVTPYYNKTSQAGLIAHYTYVADRIDAPIILYNVPSRTGVNIKPETYFELSKHKNIVATKEANSDIASIAKTAYLCGDELNIYSGNDDQIVPVMSLGGLGVISVLSNVLPKQTHEMCSLMLAEKTSQAANMQKKYMQLIDALFCDVNPIPVKQAMNLLGYNAGPCRLPLYDMSEKDKALLTKALADLNLL